MHPLHDVLPNNTLWPILSVIWSNHFRSIEAEVPALDGSPSRIWWSHHPCNGRKNLWPQWGKQVPIRVFLEQSRVTSGLVARRASCMLCYVPSWAMGLSRRRTSNVCWRLCSIKPSQNEVSKIPTHFYVSFLNALMNLDRYIKYSTGSSVKHQIRKDR